MEASKTLAEFKKKIDPEIRKYFDDAIKETEKIDRNVAGSLGQAKKIIMAGGKRARAAFMYYGYLAAGGKDIKRVLKTSISIELVHLFLLIHDDVIDRDSKRHGVKTIHSYYEKVGRKFFKNKDFKHFGNSMGIIVGDTIGALGSQVLFTSGFDTELVVRALNKLQEIISMTGIGESKDIYIENQGKATEKEILKMYEYKTAKYTFEGPLHLGAILAGADNKFLDDLSAYAIPAGIAFQIQDDILGIFGDEKKLGKPVGSDIRQGKYTILVTEAFKKADNKQRRILNENLGNKNLSKNDIEEFRKVITETGALDYARNMAAKLVDQSRKTVSNVKMDKGVKKFLVGIANYMVNREI